MNAKTIFVLTRAAIVAAALPVTAFAADTSAEVGDDAALADANHALGQHPAVLVYKNWANHGYDYASKFYLHPARLTLLLEAPGEMGEHPAVLVARQQRNRGYEDATKIGLHPALLRGARAAVSAETNPASDRSRDSVFNVTARQETRSVPQP